MSGMQHCFSSLRNSGLLQDFLKFDYMSSLGKKKKKKNYQEENNRASTPPRNSEYFCIKIGIMMAAYSVSNSAIYCKAIAIILWLREAYLKVHSMPLIKDVPSVHLLQ